MGFLTYEKSGIPLSFFSCLLKFVLKKQTIDRTG